MLTRLWYNSASKEANFFGDIFSCVRVGLFGPQSRQHTIQLVTLGTGLAVSFQLQIITFLSVTSKLGDELLKTIPLVAK